MKQERDNKSSSCKDQSVVVLLFLIVLCRHVLFFFCLFCTAKRSDLKGFSLNLSIQYNDIIGRAVRCAWTEILFRLSLDI
jgi:hypothetical protein